MNTTISFRLTRLDALSPEPARNLRRMGRPLGVGHSVRAMDQETRTQIAARVLDVTGFFHEEYARNAIDGALQLVPRSLGYRVREGEGATVVEIVTETRLFTATVTSDQNDHVVVDLTARRLDEALVDVNMTQRGQRRFWTFQFGEDDAITVDRADDAPFAQALASRLGWAEPTAD
jgi:hypothetical protein